MTEERKNNAEEAQVVVETTTQNQKRQKKSLGKRIWGGVCSMVEFAVENPGKVLTGVAAGVLLYKGGEAVGSAKTRKKTLGMLNHVHSEGIKKGIGYGAIEHSRASEQYKENYCDINNLNREGCKEFEGWVKGIVNEAIAAEKSKNS